MASLLVTPEAAAYIADAIEREQMLRPLVVVSWNVGEADVTRTARGEAIWKRGPSKWFVSVIDVATQEQEVQALGIADYVPPVPNFNAQGFPLFLWGKPGNRMLEDCRIELVGEELCVRENGI